MAAPLTASLPEGLVLDDGYVVTLDAVSPTTGAPVSGVVVSDATIASVQSSPRPPLPDNPPPLLAHEPA